MSQASTRLSNARSRGVGNLVREHIFQGFLDLVGDAGVDRGVADGAQNPKKAVVSFGDNALGYEPGERGFADVLHIVLGGRADPCPGVRGLLAGNDSGEHPVEEGNPCRIGVTKRDSRSVSMR